MKKIDSEAKGMLIDRIKSVVETGKITQDMADWADPLSVLMVIMSLMKKKYPFTPQ